jgi:hypothetical protein
LALEQESAVYHPECFYSSHAVLLSAIPDAKPNYFVINTSSGRIIQETGVNSQAG